MKLDINVQELQVLLAPGQKAQEDVIRLTAEVERLNTLRTSNQNSTGTGGYTQDHQRDAILNALVNVCKAVANGNKILAIKITRELTGVGLKEAKDIVEGAYNDTRVRQMY